MTTPKPATAAKCGDSKCWCAEASGIVIASSSPPEPGPLSLRPFHLGWWEARKR